MKNQFLNCLNFLVYFTCMNRISCIIFDLDGTLSQTNELIYATFNHVAQKHLQRTFTPVEITSFFGPPEEVAVEKLVGRGNYREAIRDFYSFYEAHHARLATLHEGMGELLEFLKNRGILLAVFTGKGKRTTLITLEKMGISQYFDAVVTGSDVKNHKPSPDGIRMVLERFSLDPGSVLMVGDSVSDVKAAQEAGTAVAAVLWDSYGKEKVLEMNVNYTFHTVGEFMEWLKDMLPES